MLRRDQRDCIIYYLVRYYSYIFFGKQLTNSSRLHHSSQLEIDPNFLLGKREQHQIFLLYLNVEWNYCTTSYHWRWGLEFHIPFEFHLWFVSGGWWISQRLPVHLESLDTFVQLKTSPGLALQAQYIFVQNHVSSKSPGYPRFGNAIEL